MGSIFELTPAELAAKRRERLDRFAAAALGGYCILLAGGPLKPEAITGAVDAAEALLVELERRERGAGQAVQAAPPRPPALPVSHKIQPAPRDREHDAALDASSPGGGGAAVVRPEPPEPEGGR